MRAHKTLQDRLVKELRLAGAGTLAQGNALLPAFIANYNARFAKPPVNSKDLHRPMRKRVTVVDYPDGRLVIRYNGVELAYRTFDKIQQVDQGAIADNKRLGAVLAMIRAQQLSHEPQHRSQRAPRRRDQRDARLFKVG